NADGTLPSSWTTNGTTLPANRSAGALGAMNGHLYYIGGHDGTLTYENVYYAPLNADGSVGTWSTQNTSNDLPAPRDAFAYAQSPIAMYAIGGYDNDVEDDFNTTYYTTFPRVQIGGGLDLTAYSGENLAD